MQISRGFPGLRGWAPNGNLATPNGRREQPSAVGQPVRYFRLVYQSARDCACSLSRVPRATSFIPTALDKVAPFVVLLLIVCRKSVPSVSLSFCSGTLPPLRALFRQSRAAGLIGNNYPSDRANGDPGDPGLQLPQRVGGEVVVLVSKLR